MWVEWYDQVPDPPANHSSIGIMSKSSSVWPSEENVGTKQLYSYGYSSFSEVAD